MDIELLVPLVTTLISLVAGVGSSTIYDYFLKRLGSKSEEPNQDYSQKISKLTESLHESSQQLDGVLAEISAVTQDREKAIKQLEANLGSLEAKENELKERVESLQSISIPAIEHLAKVLEPGEKRSAKRDYILFGSGVLVSIFVSIALKALGLG